MNFTDEKDPGLIPQILSKILDSSVNGITLADPDLEDMPLVYVNKAFEKMTGYTMEEVVGKNCRFMQGEDRDHALKERHMMQKAFKNNESTQSYLQKLPKKWRSIFQSPRNVATI